MQCLRSIPSFPCGPLSVHAVPISAPPLRLRSGAVVPGSSCCRRRQGPREGGGRRTLLGTAPIQRSRVVLPCCARARCPRTPTHHPSLSATYHASGQGPPGVAVQGVRSLVPSQIAPASEVGLSSSVSLNVCPSSPLCQQPSIRPTSSSAALSRSGSLLLSHTARALPVRSRHSLQLARRSSSSLETLVVADCKSAS